jgi:hypothetical protein
MISVGAVAACGLQAERMTIADAAERVIAANRREDVFMENRLNMKENDSKLQCSKNQIDATK